MGVVLAEAVDERDLVESAKADASAFGVLYDLYFPGLYSFAYHRTGSHHEAEDVAAETFRRALENLGSYQSRGVSFAAWLHRIAANLVADGHRRARPHVDLAEASALRSRDPLPEEEVVRREGAQELASAVRELPAGQQQAVVLRFSRGLHNREIGEVMGRSEGAVKLLLHRALAGLRDRVRHGDVQ